MAIDFDAIRKKLGQLSGSNSKRRVMWRPPQDETTTVRLIAFTDNNGNPFKERYFYYNIGNNPGLLAPYQFGNQTRSMNLFKSLSLKVRRKVMRWQRNCIQRCELMPQ